MFCYKCGKQLPDDAMFCSACGTTVLADALLQTEKEAVKPVIPTEPAVEPMQSKPEKAKKPKKEKKPVNPGKKKTVLMILGALALLAAVIAIVWGVTDTQKKNKTIAGIPDPETYFNMRGEHTEEEITYTIDFNTDEITLEMVEAYVDLLCSDSYLFTLYAEDENVYESTNTFDRTFKLKYNGSEEPYYDTSYQILVEHYTSDVYDPHTSVLVHSHTNFGFVPGPQYDGSVSGGPAAGGADDFSVVSIPDLAHYFGAQNLSEEENEARFTFDTDPRDAVRYYVELLQNKYSVVLAEVYEDDGAGEWVLHHKDDPDAPFTIWVDRAGDGTWEVICRLHIFVIQMEWEVWEWPNAEVPTPEPTPEPEPEPLPMQQPTQQQPASKPSSSDPSVLPDFLAHDSSGKFELDEGQSRRGKAFYVALSDELQYVIEDYMKLLKGMGYTVVYEYDKEHTAGTHNIVMKRGFYHSGVDAEAVWKSESNGQVRVQTNTYPEKNKTNIVINYSDGITLEGFDGGSSSGGGSNQCSACLGDGKCNICNGSDTVSRFQAGIGWVTQNCTACSMGQCPFCNGTGR